MSTVSKHILDEIANKLEKKKDNFWEEVKRFEALSAETLRILGQIVDIFEKLEFKEEITEKEHEKLQRLFDELYERDDLYKIEK